MTDGTSGPLVSRRRLLARAGVAAVALAAAGGVLEACGPAKGATGAAKPSSTTHQKVTLSFLTLTGTNEQTMYKSLVDTFTQRYPYITVQMSYVSGGAVGVQSKLMTGITAGTAPDVIWTHSYITPALVAAKALLPLDSFITASNYDLGAFLPSPLKDFHVGGKQYGLPRETTAFLLWYNADLLNRAAAPLPQAGWKWQDLTEAAGKAQQPKNGVWGITGMTDDIYMELVKTWQGGGDILGPQRKHYTLDQQPGVAAAQFIQGLIWGAKLHPTPNLAGLGGLFAGGKAVFQPMYSNFSAMAGKTFKWDVAPIPTDGVQTTREASAGHSIVAETKYPEEAWLLLQHLEDRAAFEIYAQSVAMPSRRSVFDEAMAGKNPNILVPKSVQVIQDAFGYARPEPIAGDWVKVHSTLSAVLGKVWGASTTSALDALTAVGPQVNQLVAAIP